jgi:hypothetical protein
MHIWLAVCCLTAVLSAVCLQVYGQVAAAQPVLMGHRPAQVPLYQNMGHQDLQGLVGTTTTTTNPQGLAAFSQGTATTTTTTNPQGLAAFSQGMATTTTNPQGLAAFSQGMAGTTTTSSRLDQPFPAGHNIAGQVWGRLSQLKHTCAHP